MGLITYITSTQVAPGHYPCGQDRPGENEIPLPPGGGWSNVIPGGIANVNFTIHGTRLAFTGLGYRDHSWGRLKALVTMKLWYWGHAQLGPYILVWFDGINMADERYVSGYVARDGKIISATCNNAALTVRPYGANSTYPPGLNAGYPTAFSIEYELGSSGRLLANYTTTLDLVSKPGYYRGIGPIVGGIVGEEQYKGVTMWDEIRVDPAIFKAEH